MKVKELIAKLQQEDQEAVVKISFRDVEFDEDIERSDIHIDGKDTYGPTAHVVIAC